MLLPSTLAALGLTPEDEVQPQAFRGEGVLPISRAALKAVNQPGTELDGTDTGKPGGVRGRLVELRHRRRRPSTDVESPEEHEEHAESAGTP